MRRPLLLLVVLTACAAPEAERPQRRFQETYLDMTLDAQELAPSAVVDSALFVQVELRPMLTSDEALASIGVALPEQPLGVVELDSTQVTAIVEELRDRYLRHPTNPVITVRDGQAVSVVTEGDAPLTLRPAVVPVEGPRRIRLAIVGRGAPLDVTVPDGAVLLLRAAAPGAPRWTLVALTAISLRDD